VSLLNSLPQKAVEAESLNIFQAEVDRFLIRKEMKGWRTVEALYDIDCE